MMQPVHAGIAAAVPLPVRPAAIIKMGVADKYDVTVSEIESRRKSKTLVLARQECMYRMRTDLGYGLPRIGRLLGGLDHTTVIYGIGCHAILHDLPFPSPSTRQAVMKKPPRWVREILAERGQA